MRQLEAGRVFCARPLAYGIAHQPEFPITGHAHHVRALIYDKMRLACKREKRPDLAMQYADASDQHREEFERYRKMMDMYRVRESNKHDAKMVALRERLKAK